MKDFEVFENNGGVLILLVYDHDGETEYIHTGYEFCPGQLSQDLQALREGADPARDWDGNEIDDFVPCQLGGPWGDLIADNWGTYPHNMGAAGLREFCPDNDDY